MATIDDVLAALERIAPARYAFGFDKIGLQVGDPSARVDRAVVSLDRSLGAVDQAKQVGAQLLLSHHPLLFEPAKSVTTQTHVGLTLTELIKSDIAFIAAHTNWDSARGGVNDELAKRLGLSDVREFGYASPVSQLKMVVFALPAEVEAILDAASAAGAGKIGLYSRCAFTTEGHGTFRGGEGSNPTVGEVGRTEVVEEVRIEMILNQEDRRAVEKAVRGAHSYGEPAIDFFVLTEASEQPAGRIGVIEGQSLSEFSRRVASALGGPTWTWGDPARMIGKVAVVGGAADSEWMAARAVGADVFVTGEVRQHIALEASESGLAIIAAGHHATEHPGVEALAERMRAEMPQVEWQVFSPTPGFAGRPF